MSRYANVHNHWIPTAREELLNLGKSLRERGSIGEANLINDIVYELMFRNQYGKPVARTNQAKIDKQKVLDVLETFRTNPNQSNRRMGRQHGIDGGRVSEIINGYRTPEYPQGTPEWRGK